MVTELTRERLMKNFRWNMVGAIIGFMVMFSSSKCTYTWLSLDKLRELINDANSASVYLCIIITLALVAAYFKQYHSTSLIKWIAKRFIDVITKPLAIILGIFLYLVIYNAVFLDPDLLFFNIVIFIFMLLLYVVFICIPATVVEVITQSKPNSMF